MLEFEDDLYIVNEADMYVRICVKVVSGDVNTEVNATLFTLESTAKGTTNASIHRGKKIANRVKVQSNIN